MISFPVSKIISKSSKIAQNGIKIRGGAAIYQQTKIRSPQETLNYWTTAVLQIATVDGMMMVATVISKVAVALNSDCDNDHNSEITSHTLYSKICSHTIGSRGPGLQGS